MPRLNPWRRPSLIGSAIPLVLLGLTVATAIALVQETYRPWETMVHSNALGWEAAFDPGSASEKVLALYRPAKTPNTSSADLRLGKTCPWSNSASVEFAQARNSLEHAAYHGNAKAAMVLSEMYRCGLGMAADLREGYAWAEVAAIEGNSDARRLRDQLLDSLNSSDLRTALRRADSIFDLIQS